MREVVFIHVNEDEQGVRASIAGMHRDNALEILMAAHTEAIKLVKRRAALRHF